MEPRKPMLDRLYYNHNDESVLSYWQDKFKERNFLSGVPEEESLRNALRGQAYFDAGILPEITIRPPKDNAVYKTGYMIPNKSLRNSFYESIDDDVDQRMYINRLWELYKKAQKPSIKNVRKQIGVFPLYLKIRGGDPDRANYSAELNTMHVSPDFASEDIEAELAHAYLMYGTDFPRKYGWPRKLLSLPGDIKINGKSGYERIGNSEFDAHEIIEPLFHNYLTVPEINYSDTHDIMMDMYKNPDFYFKSVNKGPFSGTTRRIEPVKR